MLKNVLTQKVIKIQLLFHLLQPHMKSPQLLTQGEDYSRISDVVMKQRSLKAKHFFWSSPNVVNVFHILMIASSLFFQKCIISHPLVVNYPLSRKFNKIKLYDINRGTNTELLHKVLLQVSLHKLHLDVLKKYSTGFFMAYDEKEFFGVSDSDL